MLKSLYSGISGMKNLQTKMDVISNNIANVNTTSFKTGRVRFEDMISQSLKGAEQNINGKQVGLGMQLGSIDTVMTSGSLQPTGRDLDFGIESGDNSFFAVSGNGTNTDVLYTRDGGFYMNPDNELVTASGYRVLGRMLDEPVEYTGAVPPGLATGDLEALSVPKQNGTIALDSYSIGSDGLILGVYNDKVMVVGQMMLTNFSNAGGLEKTGANMYRSTLNSGDPVVGAAGTDGYGTIRSGFLEMSNVDLSNEFSEMIVAQRAYQASSRSISTSDQMLEELLSLKR